MTSKKRSIRKKKPTKSIKKTKLSPYLKGIIAAIAFELAKQAIQNSQSSQVSQVPQVPQVPQDNYDVKKKKIEDIQNLDSFVEYVRTGDVGFLSDEDKRDLQQKIKKFVNDKFPQHKEPSKKSEYQRMINEFNSKYNYFYDASDYEKMKDNIDVFEEKYNEIRNYIRTLFTRYGTIDESSIKEKFAEIQRKIMNPPADIPRFILDPIEKNNLYKKDVNSVISKYNSILEKEEIEDGDVDVYFHIVDIENDYENINGVGKVFVRFGGPPLRGPSIFESSGDTRMVQISNETQNICHKKVNTEYGPYSYVYKNVTNEHIYRGQIDSVVKMMSNKKFDMCFISYGLSGSGKTYTLIGNMHEKNGKTKGISHYIIDNIMREDPSTKIKCSSIQLYRGNVYKGYSQKEVIYKYTTDETKKERGVEYIPRATDIQKFNEYMLEFKNGANVHTKKDKFNRVFGLLEPKDTKQKLRDNLSNPLEGIYDKVGMVGQDGTISDMIFNTPNKQPVLCELLEHYTVSNKQFDIEDLKLQGTQDSYFTEAGYVGIKNIDDYNNYLINVMKHRPTRATARNPDSSRSHLFIEIQFESVNSKYSVYICDLGGVEKPYEYAGVACREGYYIVSSLEILKVMLNNYKNFRKTEIDEIKNNDGFKMSMKTSPGSHVKWTKSETETEDNIIKRTYDVINDILKPRRFENAASGEGLTKLVSIVNLRANMMEENTYNSYYNQIMCEATHNSLEYGQELMKVKNSSHFGKRSQRKRKRYKGLKI